VVIATLRQIFRLYEAVESRRLLGVRAGQRGHGEQERKWVEKARHDAKKTRRERDFRWVKLNGVGPMAIYWWVAWPDDWRVVETVF